MSFITSILRVCGTALFSQLRQPAMFQNNKRAKEKRETHKMFSQVEVCNPICLASVLLLKVFVSSK